MAFDGIFLRHYLGQTPTSPDTGAISGWTGSPDIIPWGITSKPNPADFTTPQSYNKNEGPGVYTNYNNNYIYVRGINTHAGPYSARLWLYHAANGLALWPGDWRFEDLYSAEGAQQNYVDVSAGSQNEVIVGSAFLWQKTPPPASPSNHYCLVAIAENPDDDHPLSDPPQGPVPLGKFDTWNDLAAYVLSHPNLAWRNVTIVPATTPDFNGVVPIKAPANGGTVNVGVQCWGIPGGQVGWEIPANSWFKDPVVFELTDVKNPNAIYSQPVYFPPGSSCVLNIQYFARGSTLVPDKSSVGSYVVQTLGALEETHPELVRDVRAHPERYRRLVDVPIKESPDPKEKAKLRKGVVFGGYELRISAQSDPGM